MSQRYMNDNINSFNTNNSFNKVWNNCTVADEKSEILAWLSPLEPQIRHQDIRTRRVDEVGDWLLQTQEYRNWSCGVGGRSNGSALFCYGGPGVGKTYISSLVIDTLCKQAGRENTTVACFYFDFAAQEEPPAAILGSMLKQVVGGLDDVPERIVETFRERERVIGGQGLALSEIVEFLQDIASSQCTFLCIDALDEYPPRYRAKLLDSLNQILQKSPCARIFLTGRPHVRDEVEKHFSGRVAARPISPTRGDITIFLRAKLKEDTIPGAMDQRLEEEIIQNIPEAVSEIFLLVFLSIETILQETTIYRRRQRLGAMKNGLDLGDAYKVTLGRIKAQSGEKARLGMTVLMWITHSRRPLQVDEICHAIAIRIGSSDLERDNIPAISTLLSCCQGLVTIEKGTSSIRLIHFTLQEYLCTHPHLFDKAHSTMAETCLTYLNFPHIKGLSAHPSPDPRGTPFLEYSSLYWGTHMRMELSDREKASALELLDQFDGHISAKFLWKSINAGLPSHYYSCDEPFSSLHCISYFGIAEVATALIGMNRWDVNQRDSAGMTPLIWASRYGHEEVVRLFLQEKHIQFDPQDTNYGRTALSWAAGNGHEGVVRIFLGPEFVNPGSIGRWWGEAPRVVGLFGGKYVNPDSSSKGGQTPLLWAAGNGHEGIVKLLLGRKDVNPNCSSESGLTPLSWAAENGHCGIVKLLLEREDVNPNYSNESGLTPLYRAAKVGHEGIVELLLGREDVNPDILDRYGQTPLLRATEKGHEGVVKLLLGRKDVNPDTPDRAHGQTPLSCAAERGYEGIVKLLFRRKDVNPDTPDTRFGRNPLSWAAQKGHEGIVELLLGRNVNYDTPDTAYGQTPLSWAAGSGHVGIVKLLLGREGVNPDRTNKSGQTPFSLAAANGHEGVVELLFGREDVDANAPDTESGRTPLSWAAGRGHEGIVRLLLGCEGVNPDALDAECGQTPLSWAAENGHEGIVKLLLAREDVSPDPPDAQFGRTPLLWAAKNGHVGVVKLLLGREGVDPNTTCKSGRTPLALAAENGHDRVVELLQSPRSPHIPKLDPRLAPWSLVSWKSSLVGSGNTT